MLTFLLLTITSLPPTAEAWEIAKNPPPLESGVLDCRRWEFDQQGIIRIKGQAEFYWQELLGPEDFAPGTGRAAGYAQIPSAWNSLPGKGYPALGFATYRAVLLVPPDIEVLGMYMSNQDTAYRMFWNGHQVSENGRPAESDSEHRPQRVPRDLYLPVQNGRAELVVQVSNFEHRWGGLNNGILIGLPMQITGLNRLYLGFSLLLGGGFFLIFLYHTVTFAFRPADKTHLLIALFTLVLSLRVFFTGEYLAYQFFPTIAWHLGIKYEYLSMPLFVLLFTLFLKEMEPRDMPRRLPRIIGLTTLLPVAAVIVLPVRLTLTRLSLPVQLVTFCAGAVAFFFFLRSIYRRRTGAVLMVAGLAALLGAAAWDILAWNRVLPPRRVGPMVYPGFLVFILMNSLVLSRRMAFAYNRLDYLTAGLEREVAERTEELLCANEKIREAAEAQMQFYIHLSHEIKTPLTLIINAFNAYIAKTGTTSELEIVKVNLDRLLGDIIDFFDIYTWSRNKNLYRHDCRTDFSALLREKLALLESSFRKKNLSVTVQIEGGLVLDADPSAIGRLILNLIDNAVKYNREGGTIRLSARHDAGALVFTVQDSGAGVPAENIEDIFLPYYRVARSGERIDGMGVGLAVVRHIVESLRGTVECRGADGGGCVFTVRLPAGAVDGESQAVDGGSVPSQEILTASVVGSWENRPVPDTASREVILVVEDDPDMRRLLSEGLEEDYRVYSAEDGVAALYRLGKIEKPSLVICDIMMKEMSGIELLRRVKEEPQYSDIPFLFCTARGHDGDASAAYQEGALDYIYKPFLLPELRSKIRSLFRFTRLKDELAEKERLFSHGTILSGLAHEIRNPLSGISGPLGVVKKYFTDNSREIPVSLQSHFSYIEEGIRRINCLVDNLKKIWSGEKPVVEHLLLRQLISETLDELPPGAAMTFINEIPPEYLVSGEGIIMKLALTQVLKNSLDALGDQGTVRVWADVGEPRRFYVADDGPGIGTEECGRIFEPFYTAGKSGGMGLGLTIARALLERINWKLTLVDHNGVGACFRFEEDTDG